MLKFASMAILAVALLQQHDARRDILIEPAARRRAAIEAPGHSELGAQSGRKNQPACCIPCCTVQLIELFFGAGRTCDCIKLICTVSSIIL